MGSLAGAAHLSWSNAGVQRSTQAERKSAVKQTHAKRHVIPLKSEEGEFFLNVILRMAYSKPYRESVPNKMAPLASILWLLHPVFF